MLDKLQLIVRNNTENPSIVLTPDMVLATDLGLNSLDIVELVMKIEDEFNVEIPDRTISNFINVQDVIDYLQGNM